MKGNFDFTENFIYAFRFIYLLFNMYDCFVFMYVCMFNIWLPSAICWPERDIKFPGTSVTNVCELPCANGNYFLIL